MVLVGLPRWLDVALEASFTLQELFGRARMTNEKDLRLYLAIITESVRQTRISYPQSKFDIILWDDRDDPRLAVIDAELRRAGIPLHSLTSIIPKFNSERLWYVLSKHDNHPNALAHGIIVDYIARTILSGLAGGADGGGNPTCPAVLQSGSRH